LHIPAKTINSDYERCIMGEESGTPARTINIQIAPNAATGTEVQELVDGITQKVGEAVQTWQERLKERNAAKSVVPLAPPCAAR
jgi:hypothetical protein